MQYRRSNTKGGTYFFTVNLANRSQTLLVDNYHLLKEAIRIVKQRHPFHIDAMVVLPDHLHTIWTLPVDDADFSKRWGLIKSGFSRKLPKNELRSKSRQSKAERGIWQRRFWEHQIRNQQDYNQHIDYIHYNPVKHGYVSKPSNWPQSSIHKFIQNAVINNDWGANEQPVFNSAIVE
ncbi:MAG: transposase [Gammaproteobacteria bacterium]|nr:transposase [Gammaproteobacteria bacterium]MCW8922709.1 transposase [Gammaproteobacteria bacterium]